MNIQCGWYRICGTSRIFVSMPEMLMITGGWISLTFADCQMNRMTGSKENIKIFTDFDGTIAVNDVGDALFERYARGDIAEPSEKWARGEISSRELYEQLFRITRLTEAEFAYFCRSQPIDEHFPAFVTFCEHEHLSLTVLSDGLDQYIKQILGRYHLDHLTVFANKMVFEDTNRIRPGFPYQEHQCPYCANCKGYHLRKNRKPGDWLVFIGDGISDQCAVREADVVFAKHQLEQYCQEHGIAYYPYANFRDVQAGLRELISQLQAKCKTCSNEKGTNHGIFKRNDQHQSGKRM